MQSPAPSILAYNSSVIGVVNGTRWSSPDSELTLKARRTGYTVTIGAAKPGVTVDVIEPIGMLSGINLRGGQAKYPGVVWLGSAPKFPRPVRTQTADRTLYAREVHRALNSRLVSLDQVEVTRLFRVDLDGDKVDEVLVEARTKGLNLMGGSIDSKPGMFTGVWIRAVRNGRPTMLKLQADVVVEDARHFDNRLAAVADFDGDGRYEVVVSSLGFESESGHVYRFRAGSATLISEGGVGA